MLSIFARYLPNNIVLLHRFKFNQSSLFTLQLPFNVTYVNASYSIIANNFGRGLSRFYVLLCAFNKA